MSGWMGVHTIAYGYRCFTGSTEGALDGVPAIRPPDRLPDDGRTATNVKPSSPSVSIKRTYKLSSRTLACPQLSQLQQSIDLDFGPTTSSASASSHRERLACAYSTRRSSPISGSIERAVPLLQILSR